MRQLGELIERLDALSALAVDNPRRIRLDADLLTQVGSRIQPLCIAFDVGNLGRRGPEPGLLLFAGGSPEGAVHDGLRVCEMPGEGGRIPLRR